MQKFIKALMVIPLIPFIFVGFIGGMMIISFKGGYIQADTLTDWMAND